MIPHRTPLDGLMLIETHAVADERGQFTRIFCGEAFAGLGLGRPVAQANLSRTQTRGTVRGMHFQHPPAAEGKLVRCVRGKVFDVAVDLRRGSPTFLQWHGVELEADKPLQVYIPEGFAHGFQSLEDDVELLYLHTASWCREAEGRLRHDDPRLAIHWPLSVTRISEADRNAPLMPADYPGVDA